MNGRKRRGGDRPGISSHAPGEGGEDAVSGGSGGPTGTGSRTAVAGRGRAPGGGFRRREGPRGSFRRAHGKGIEDVPQVDASGGADQDPPERVPIPGAVRTLAQLCPS